MRDFKIDDYERFKQNCVFTDLKFIVKPRRCFISKRILWLEWAYKQTAVYTDYSTVSMLRAYNPEISIEERYYDKKQYMLGILKGIV